MFFANVGIAEKYDYLDDKFKAAYKWLRETDIMSLSVGKYPILGDDVVANIQEYTTVPEDTKKFEAHEKFFDVQYLASGIERFGICKTEGLKEVERHDDRDLIFFETPENFGSVVLKEGDLIVVAPEDAHRPQCAVGEPIPVKKVVIKVRV